VRTAPAAEPALPCIPPAPQSLVFVGQSALTESLNGSRVSASVGYMRRAMELAERGRGLTAPNPDVGAVIVRAGRVVGEGWHRGAGRDHAEIEALAHAGRKARGATLFVTLEPCAHWGRTPPCVDAIIAAGITRVVAASRDPDPRVNGRGLQRLRAAGIQVDLGLLADEARAQIAAYRRARLLGMPRVTWKVAATLDGRMADTRGRSRWITGAAARADGHRLRAASDAIVVGAGTARADDPQLTARAAGRDAHDPLRVVVDSMLSLPASLRLFRKPLAPGTVVACTTAAPAARERRLVASGVRVWRLPARRGLVSPAALAGKLVEEGRYEVLLEGGATLGAAFLGAGLVQRLVLYTAPAVLGGGLSWCNGLDRPLDRMLRGRIAAHAVVGNDIRLVVDLET